MAKLDKLTKVGENITLNRYDNGWMVEVNGRNADNDWQTIKTICSKEEELLSIVKEWNLKPLDN